MIQSTTTLPNNAYELSPLQQGMLFHALHAGASGVDIEQISMRLNESLELSSFAAAWQHVVGQHDILRSRFDWESASAPMQIVESGVTLPIAETDLRSLDTELQEASLVELKRGDRYLPFDLTQVPLMRLNVVQLADDDFFVLWTFHHILLDGRSFPLLLEQVFQSYAALVSGKALPELPASRPFRDYIAWRGEQDFGQGQSYWEMQLADFSAKSAIEFGPQTHGEGPHWGEVELNVSAENTTALANFAQSTGVTMHTLLQAAWSLLLHHYSGDDDVVFASTRACRHWSSDAANMIGLFINTVPVRTRTDDKLPLIDYLRSLRQQQIALRSHEHTGLNDIQRWSDIGRGETLFDSLVVYDNLTLHDRMQAKGDAYANRHFAYHGQTNFPLTVLAYGGDSLLLRIEHQHERFSAEIAQNILAQLHTIMLNMLGRASAPALRIPYFSARDRQQLFSVWNTPLTDQPTWSVHDKISEQAQRTPDKVAVLTPANGRMRRQGRTLTYRELDNESTELARHLRQIGVGPGQFVGVCMQRNANLIIALLGVLKAGAVYVPIDPDYPRDRINHMFDDSAASVVITDRKSWDRLPNERENLQILDMDNLEAMTLSFNRKVAVQPTDLAYMIYTSGSTGKPKGVQVPHGALSNFLHSMSKQPGITAQDVLLAVTTVSFDIAALEIFLPLLTGATLCLASAETASDGHDLVQTLQHSPITVMQATPATWRMMLEANWQGDSKLKILCGGEPLPRRLADELLTRGSELWNMYGPTETTIWSTISQVSADDAAITIGTAIDNTSCFILDKQLRPVPPGVIGELVIGGAGVTAGYKNRPKLTDEKFIDDEFTPLAAEGAKLYRTGDMARFNPNGTLDCLGRIDHQVKIRGFRIELGEIESVLSQHDAVSDICVVAREKQPGVKHLVAYIIPQGEAPPISALRKFSKTKLPDYMIPAAFVMLDAFPLTNNGKINRLALPEPDGSRPELDEPFVAPYSDAEKAIARIWRDILLVNRVGVNDSFFDLGGDSLLVVRAISTMRRHFNSKLSVHKLYEYRTVKALAGYLSEAAQPVSAESNSLIDERAAKRRQALKRRRGKVA